MTTSDLSFNYGMAGVQRSLALIFSPVGVLVCLLLGVLCTLFALNALLHAPVYWEQFAVSAIFGVLLLLGASSNWKLFQTSRQNTNPNGTRQSTILITADTLWFWPEGRLKPPQRVPLSALTKVRVSNEDDDYWCHVKYDGGNLAFRSRLFDNWHRFDEFCKIMKARLPVQRK